MQLTFSLMSEEEAHIVCSWRYEGPYAVYNMSDTPESIAEMLDQRSPYYIVRNEQRDIVGFFSFGTSALVWGSSEPGIYIEERTVAIGLGMRPDLTGKGLGLAFVNAGLEFARKTFTVEHFCLFVFAWNERAIRVYERAGFQRGYVVAQHNERGKREFLQMTRDA